MSSNRRDVYPRACYSAEGLPPLYVSRTNGNIGDAIVPPASLSRLALAVWQIQTERDINPRYDIDDVVGRVVHRQDPYQEWSYGEHYAVSIRPDPNNAINGSPLDYVGYLLLGSRLSNSSDRTIRVAEIGCRRPDSGRVRQYPAIIGSLLLPAIKDSLKHEEYRGVSHADIKVAVCSDTPSKAGVEAMQAYGMPFNREAGEFQGSVRTVLENLKASLHKVSLVNPATQEMQA